VPAPARYATAAQEESLLSLVPSAQGLVRSEVALYELLGEVVREALASLHIRRQASLPAN
jgi:hypothetical protein